MVILSNKSISCQNFAIRSKINEINIEFDIFAKLTEGTASHCSHQNEGKARFLPPEFSVVIEVANGQLFGGRSWNVFDLSSSQINQMSDNKPYPPNVS